MSNFLRVATMNEAFNNPQGDPNNIDWERLQKQCKNIGDEYIELLDALGTPPHLILQLKELFHEIIFTYAPDIDGVRDALCDIRVFAYGANHMMGIDADRDMEAVIDGVMTRFIKDEADKQATIAKHAAKGVTNVYFEGEFPVMVMKSGSDQPDAPKGKFLKSASYQEPVFSPV